MPERDGSEGAPSTQPRVIAGRYLIRRVLGEGGQKVVYLVHDTGLDRPCALSLIRAELVDPDQLVRLRREAQALARLGPHSNIVTIYDLGEEDGRPYFVAEYLPGGDLRGLLRTADGPLPIERALALSQDVCEALAFAHGRSLVHRDVKPSNVWLSENGTAKLGDFGLALVSDRSRVTTSGAIVGTADYLSPEQAKALPLDARSDLYSFGCVLYEMVTGRTPFRGSSPLEVISQHVHAAPIAARQRNPAVPTSLDQLLTQLLEKIPGRRPWSAVEVLNQLARVRLELPAGARAGAAGKASPRRPKTRYAKNGDVNIAYQVLGDGPTDLVCVPGWVSNLDHVWSEPSLARFYERLAAFSRLILFDKRGTGLSDQTAEPPGLEQRMDDVRAVMDAVSSRRSALFGASEGGNMCMLFAATYPERTIALITCGSFAKRVWDPEYPWAPTPTQREKWFRLIEEGWGGVVDLPTLAPSVANDENFRQWWAGYLRSGASPGAALALARMNTAIDVRHVLPAIRVPTLVFHRTGDLDVSVEEGRYIARHIPGAKLVELPGDDHLFWVGDQEPMLQAIEGFLRDSPREIEADSVLATVLVGETSREWPASFEAPLRRELERFKGRRVEAAFTGLLAVFDGPRRAIQCACALLFTARPLGLPMRIGLHTGEVELAGEQVRGVALNVGRQVAAQAGAGEVLVSSTVRDLIAGSGFQFQARGVQFFQSLGRELGLFAVELLASPTLTDVRR